MRFPYQFPHEFSTTTDDAAEPRPASDCVVFFYSGLFEVSYRLNQDLTLSLLLLRASLTLNLRSSK